MLTPFLSRMSRSMLNTPFTPWPNFSEEEADAVKQVILSNKVNYWTGNECRTFEREFADWTGCNFAVALANGTVALDLALKALDIGPGDEVIVTPRTFLASVSCVVNAGATPVFADVDLNSQNIEAGTIASVLSAKTKAVIVVHLSGMPADMDPIMALSKTHGFFVIEDCAQAHGAKYKNRSVGSIGHIGAWSFCQDKIMSTGGEGGMVTTNDKILWQKMWSYKDHGKSYNAVYERQHPAGFRWLHDSFGTNWRMTEVQAVIGRIQLKRMMEWSNTRRKYFAMLNDALNSHSLIRTVAVPEFMLHGAYKFYCFIKPDNLALGWSRDRIVEEVVASGVPCYQGSCSEVYLENAFNNTDLRPTERLGNAKELGETSIMLLVHPTLTFSEIQLTATNLLSVLDCALA
ncbi:DegT/DnrJ/EryC1/StrS aminotransferase family protein [Rheinheimera baltica]|uniref:DegT/DnrJ/EryC1/StrS aminotransferase family protein n=1 Tax=Rheinheimera baltica TaxID=67576 RepID=A0ABT9HUZ6_9GAMM|nr:DegT/DnrJ/EryC1/StrS aminotransferase family protein [Rheinheimera baltica]MDP5134948.1 DegT/DnrJ/EryC1/StrS aminotransferase family protein [Rheinheimera baltica]